MIRKALPTGRVFAETVSFSRKYQICKPVIQASIKNNIIFPAFHKMRHKTLRLLAIHQKGVERMLFNLAQCMVLFLISNFRKLFVLATENSFSEMELIFQRNKNCVWKLLLVVS